MAMRGVLPEPIPLRRDKVGYNAPVAQWLGNGLGEWLWNEVNDPEFVDHGGGGADAFSQANFIGAQGESCGSGRVVAAVFEGFEKLSRDKSEVISEVRAVTGKGVARGPESAQEVP